MCLSFQDARLGEICCFTSIKIPDGRREKSGAAMFWHNGWFLLLNCIFSALWWISPVLHVGFFFNFWEEECSLFFLGGDFYSHSTVSKNSLLSDLAQTAPMTGRALSPKHDSQPPGHPAKADLSFMGVLGLVLKWRLLKGPRKERERGTSFLGKLRLNAGGEKDTSCPNGMGLSQREKQSAAQRGCDQLVKEE